MTDADAGRYAYSGLERVFHEKARLGILTSLMTTGGQLRFAELKDLCSLTDGNLSRHLKMLENAELVTIIKRQRSGRPETVCQLTETGRQRFREYLDVLEQLLSDTKTSRADET